MEKQKGSVDVNTSQARYRAPGVVLQGGDRLRKLGLSLVGGMFLVAAGIHIGIVGADAQQYRHFADAALPIVRAAWRDVFMANPSAWGSAVAVGELLIGTAILVGGRWTRPGLASAIGFHVALMLFGLGFWVWSFPMLVLLIALWPRSEAATRGTRDNDSCASRTRSHRGES